MNRFTVEETNLMSIYSEGGKREVMENINAAMPYMDGDMRELAKRTLSKVDGLTENEYLPSLESCLKIWICRISAFTICAIQQLQICTN